MLLQPLARLVGEHIVSGDVAGLAGGIDDIIPALVVGSSCWEIYSTYMCVELLLSILQSYNESVYPEEQISLQKVV